MKASIVAYDRNRTIGHHGAIPWQGKMRHDVRFFREMTLGHPIIMGRSTFDAIGRLLPGRPNIIVTRQNLDIPGGIVVHSLQEAYERANELDTDIFVIGGGQIYEAAMDTIDTIYATEVDVSSEGDAHFPALDPAVWHETARKHYQKDSDNTYDYDFVTYEITPKE